MFTFLANLIDWLFFYNIVKNKDMNLYEKTKKNELDGCLYCGSEKLEFYEVHNMTNIFCMSCASTILCTHQQFRRIYGERIMNKTKKFIIINKVNQNLD